MGHLSLVHHQQGQGGGGWEWYTWPAPAGSPGRHCWCAASCGTRSRSPLSSAEPHPGPGFGGCRKGDTWAPIPWRSGPEVAGNPTPPCVPYAGGDLQFGSNAFRNHNTAAHFALPPLTGSTPATWKFGGSGLFWMSVSTETKRPITARRTEVWAAWMYVAARPLAHVQPVAPGAVVVCTPPPSRLPRTTPPRPSNLPGQASDGRGLHSRHVRGGSGSTLWSSEAKSDEPPKGLRAVHVKLTTRQST